MLNTLDNNNKLSKLLLKYYILYYIVYKFVEIIFIQDESNSRTNLVHLLIGTFFFLQGRVKTKSFNKELILLLTFIRQRDCCSNEIDI